MAPTGTPRAVAARHYYYALLGPELERWLAREVALRYPSLRPGFARPGLSTFAAESAVEFSPWLARRSGATLGLVQSLEQGLDVLGSVAPGLVAVVGLERYGALSSGGPGAAFAAQLEEALRDRGLLAERGAVVHPRQLVLDVVAAGPERWLLGAHRVKQGEGPGGAPAPEVSVPEGAPSRAYGKLVEVIRAAAVELSPGQRVVELGASPGGGTYALLERGLSVLAVDAAPLDEGLAAQALARGVTLAHVPRAARTLTSDDLAPLGGAAEWLVSDMNLAPPVALAQAERALALLRPGLRGVILTLKLNDERALGAVEPVASRLGALLRAPTRLLHVPSHRRELAVVALTGTTQHRSRRSR
jgi:23S rRNA (cytidine2498-2'-O)-methyltransferase